MGIEDLSLYPCSSRKQNASHPDSTGCDEGPKHFLDNEGGIHKYSGQVSISSFEVKQMLSIG